jgi:hypothetical protein
MSNITNFPNGIWATPNLGASGGDSYDGFFSNEVYYVDGVNGSDTANGDAEHPFATIQAAVTAAGAYDTIYVRPKYPLQGVNQGQPNVYAENITIPITKTGLKIVGTTPAGDPYMGVKIKPANNTSPAVLVNASGVLLENLNIMNQALTPAGVMLTWMGDSFNAASTDASHILYAGSCGATIRNCEFREGHTLAIPYIGGCGASIVIRGGYNSTIVGCTFVAGSTHQAIQIGDDIVPSRNHKVIGCDFLDNNGAVADCYIITQAGNHMGIVIRDCTFGLATKFITIGAANSGILARCSFADGSTTTVAKSSGKIVIPSTNDLFTVAGCWGGGGALILADGA